MFSVFRCRNTNRKAILVVAPNAKEASLYAFKMAKHARSISNIFTQECADEWIDDHLLDFTLRLLLEKDIYGCLGKVVKGNRSRWTLYHLEDKSVVYAPEIRDHKITTNDCIHYPRKEYIEKRIECEQAMQNGLDFILV